MPTLQVYEFTQLTPSSVWSIQHNLGIYPIVDVIINNNGVWTKILPLNIVMIDLNNIEIKFSAPSIGQARIV